MISIVFQKYYVFVWAILIRILNQDAFLILHYVTMTYIST